jgi:hypothetical protein
MILLPPLSTRSDASSHSMANSPKLSCYVWACGELLRRLIGLPAGVLLGIASFRGCSILGPVPQRSAASACSKRAVARALVETPDVIVQPRTPAARASTRGEIVHEPAARRPQLEV